MLSIYLRVCIYTPRRLRFLLGSRTGAACHSFINGILIFVCASVKRPFVIKK
jgi:hypothetical protein